MTWAIEQDCGGAGPKLVLVCIANYADENGNCWPSQKRLAKDSNQTERSVRAHLSKLEAKDFLQRKPRTRSDGTFDSDYITLNLQRKILPTEELTDGKKRPPPAENISGKPITEPINTLCKERVRAYRIPEDWQPDEQCLAYAKQQGLSDARIAKAVEDFRDHWIDKREKRPGWERSWKRWVRNEVAWAAERKQSKGDGQACEGLVATMRSGIAQAGQQG